MLYTATNLGRSNRGRVVEMYVPNAKLAGMVKVVVAKRVYRIPTLLSSRRDDNSSSNRHRIVFVSGKSTTDAWAVQPSSSKDLLKITIVP